MMQRLPGSRLPKKSSHTIYFLGPKRSSNVTTRVLSLVVPQQPHHAYVLPLPTAPDATMRLPIRSCPELFKWGCFYPRFSSLLVSYHRGLWAGLLQGLLLGTFVAVADAGQLFQTTRSPLVGLFFLFCQSRSSPADRSSGAKRGRDRPCPALVPQPYEPDPGKPCPTSVLRTPHQRNP
ncbi:hypothetical protein VTG60DRAFT_5938 [Thermothelomyces hinnuleus]